MTSIEGRSAEEMSAADVDSGRYYFRLYVSGRTNKSATATANLEQICEKYLTGLYEIELIDLLQAPRLAARDQILAIPTLVRHLPGPPKRIIGTLSDTDQVLIGLGVDREHKAG